MHKTQLRNKHTNNHDVAGDITKIKALLAETTRDVKGRAGEIWSNSFDAAKEKTTAIQNTVTDYIAEKPIKSLGLAVLTGFILGVFLRRK